MREQVQKTNLNHKNPGFRLWFYRGENVTGMGGKDVIPIVEPDNHSVEAEDA